MIICNDRLVHYGLVKNNLCYYCQEQKESIIHLLSECKVVQNVWNEVLRYLCTQYQITTASDEVTNVEFILNDPDTHEIDCVSLAILIFKQKVYACKCQNKQVNSHIIIRELEFIHNMEKEKACTIPQIIKYNARWPDTITIETSSYQKQYISEIEI